jgi:hypothetical protein
MLAGTRTRRETAASSIPARRQRPELVQGDKRQSRTARRRAGPCADLEYSSPVAAAVLRLGCRWIFHVRISVPFVLRLEKTPLLAVVL